VKGVLIILYIAIIVLVIAGFWRVFTKAGESGWKSIIPIWNIIVLLRIIGRPLWWILLLLIPLVNIIISLIISLDLAKSFGKGTGFGIGLWLLGFIFVPILGFGEATYQRGGPGGAPATV
jgi:Family of unknown function (DUF5684)